MSSSALHILCSKEGVDMDDPKSDLLVKEKYILLIIDGDPEV